VFRLAVLGALVVCGCLDVPGPPTIDEPAAGDAAPAADEPIACDDIFGNAPGYHLCGEAADRCEFYTSAGDDGCAAICDSFGAACIDAYDADEPELCVEMNQDDCQGERGDIVCVCARGL
jgi:hypothetical protein